MICAERIGEYLKTENVTVKLYESIDSTNAEAKRYALANETGDPCPVLFVAKEQSAGRGRMGRFFLSRAESGIYMSLLYYTDAMLSDAVSVTTAAAAITAETIEELSGERMRIKWVNDLYNDSGKVCGILTETLAVGERRAIVVGIGINVGQVDFPDTLRKIASSVALLVGRECELIARVVDGLLRHAADPCDRSYMAIYRERFMLTGARVDLLQNGERIGRGLVLGVDDDGGLLFLPDGQQESVVVHTGEVSIRAVE